MTEPEAQARDFQMADAGASETEISISLRGTAIMFEKLGQIASLMKNLPKMQEEVGKLQGRIAQITAEGDAGGGMVKAKVNGHMEILACIISDEAMKTGDKELLEDLIRAAVNQALQKAKQAVAEETSKLAVDMGVPPGFRMPF